MLDPIHHQGLRLALEAFRTSPTASLYVEADEPSLNTRREKLSLQYAIRIAENNSNPAHGLTFQPKYTDLYERSQNEVLWYIVLRVMLLTYTRAMIQFSNCGGLSRMHKNVLVATVVAFSVNIRKQTRSGSAFPDY